MPKKSKVVRFDDIISLAAPRLEAERVERWGGARPGAGRPRTESLDASECMFLAWLVSTGPYAEEQSELVDKLLRMRDRIEQKGR